MDAFGSRIPTSVGVIDIGMANLGSIERTLSEIAQEVVVVDRPGIMSSIDRLVLPGVGAFPAAMDQLHRTGLGAEITDFAGDARRAVLGICLGMQLLSSVGEEHQETPGLGLVGGRVRRLRTTGSVRIPHVGWNSVSVSDHPIFREIENGTDFYFVHSYVFDADDVATRIATTEHGEQFTAGVGKSNVAGVQFHPEKSSRAGRRLLRNFCEWEPC